MSTKTPLEAELSALMVEALNLEMTPEEIDPQVGLYGDGLGLDSIDLLELSLAISKKYGIQLRADDADNQRIFASVASLAQHIEANRTK
ncbi:MAG TPA: phosphopantetheine-binding protein [Burkholderiales bacterium]|nr:phosphopantetheine-binding protein [Burkholderiales bacterium]